MKRRFQNIDQFLALLNGVESSGAGYQAQCPAHDDHNPSLSIGQGQDGRILLNCHAGCETGDVLSTMGLSMADLFISCGVRENNTSPLSDELKRLVETYPYVDMDGRPTHFVERWTTTSGGKSFRQGHFDKLGNKAYGVGDTDFPLYNLEHVLKTEPQKAIIIVEGEKDVNTLISLGYSNVTTIAGGAAATWKPAYTDVLRGRNIVLIPDNDQAGRMFMEMVARSLAPSVNSTRIVSLPNLPDKGDISDWFNAGNSVEKFREVVNSTPEWPPLTERLWTFGDFHREFHRDFIIDGVFKMDPMSRPLSDQNKIVSLPVRHSFFPVLARCCRERHGASFVSG